MISSRDTMAAASSVVSAATRPGSRVSRMSEMRPVFLLERCLAIRFERIQTVASPTTAPSLATGKNKGSADSRPGSSLSQQISTWLPWQRHQQSKPTNQQQQQQEQPTPPPPLPPPPTAKDSPAGWFYDGGFILYQVKSEICHVVLSSSVCFSNLHDLTGWKIKVARSLFAKNKRPPKKHKRKIPV